MMHECAECGSNLIKETHADGIWMCADCGTVMHE